MFVGYPYEQGSYLVQIINLVGILLSMNGYQCKIAVSGIQHFGFTCFGFEIHSIVVHNVARHQNQRIAI
jgi:hypothetical protein